MSTADEPRTEAGREHRKAVMDMHARLSGLDGAVQWATNEMVTAGILAIEAEAYELGYQRREMFRRELTNGLGAEIANDVATQSAEGLTNREPWRPPRAQNIIG